LKILNIFSTQKVEMFDFGMCSGDQDG